MTDAPVATPLNKQGWDLDSQTRTKGFHKFLADGLRVWTTDADSASKTAGYLAISPITLDQVGSPSMDVVNNSGIIPPGLQLYVTAGGKSGYLVYEPGAYGEGNWWSHTAFVDQPGMDYAFFGTLADLYDAYPDATVSQIGYSLGSGVKGDWTIRSITVGCVKHTFGLAAIPECKAVADAPVATPLADQGWDLTSQTRADGFHEFLADGLRVWTTGTGSTSKSAGYLTIDPVTLDKIGDPSMDVVKNSGIIPPGLQLYVETATESGYLVYEPGAYGEGNWWSHTAFVDQPGMDYAFFGTLADLYNAVPSAKVTKIGYSLGSGVQGDWTITSITVGCVKYTFGLTPIPECASVSDAATATPVDLQGWDLAGQTRTKGFHEFLTDGLRVWTTDADSASKSAGYLAITPITLDKLGSPSMEVTKNSGATPPGLQLYVTVNGKSGYLTYEPGAYGEGNWWSNTAFLTGHDGMGYAFFGTLADLYNADPIATVSQIGYSLGSGVEGDWTITSITVGCVKYTFGLAAARPEPVTFTPPRCEGSTLVPGSFTVPDVPGVAYMRQGAAVTAGTYPVAGDVTVTITAEAASAAYTLTGSRGPWERAFAALTCPTQSPTASPTPTREPTGSPTPTTSPTQSPTASPLPTVSPTQEPSSVPTVAPSPTSTSVAPGPTASQVAPSPTRTLAGLPVTGSNITPIVVLAVILLLAGGATIWFLRRRQKGQ